jgi:hypothetical protein
MREYEIRILKSRNVLALALNGSYPSDFSAIRAAQNPRRSGQTAEVWRGAECIYQEDKTHHETPSHRPAA